MPHSGVFNVVTNSMYVPPGVRLRPPVLKVSSCGAGELGLKTTLWKRIGPTPSPVPGRNWIKSALRLIFEFLGLSKDGKAVEHEVPVDGNRQDLSEGDARGRKRRGGYVTITATPGRYRVDDVVSKSRALREDEQKRRNTNDPS
jgi:hypothetical protein